MMARAISDHPRSRKWSEENELSPALADLFGIACDAEDDVDLTARQGLAVICDAIDAEYVVLAAADEGAWQEQYEIGRPREWPATLAAEAADGDGAVSSGRWIAASTAPRGVVSEVVLAEVPGNSSAESAVAHLPTLAGALGVALRAVRTQRAAQARIARQEAILEIAHRWNQAEETEPLLIEMAEAATRLLGADRASIFLWDRRTHTLVGRPALGVEEGELRVPDDRGVVGRVVQSGEPLRVGAIAATEAVAREVDKQLGYQTQTLICVPLLNKAGEVLGAFEVLNKREGEFTAADEEALIEMAAHAATALANTRERETLLAARREMSDQAAGKVQIFGDSAAIEALRSTVRRVADTDLAVLVLGENGTGKEVVSQSIHYLSRRRDEPFVSVNCAALPESLLESELFGHEKGAFTDAREARAGKFELASGGTLLLDEIGDLPLAGQAKLLRVLEEKVVVRVGGSQQIATDARVIAATNQDLAAMVRDRRFREDLFFRLNVVTIELPPLRERGDDILLLAETFLSQFCREAGRPVPTLAAMARRRLRNHTWPGNVRELRNLMERIAYLSSGDRVEADELTAMLSAAGDVGTASSMPPELAAATDSFQIDFIQTAIDGTRGNMAEAAKRLGLHRSNLYRKMRQLGMKPDRSLDG